MIYHVGKFAELVLGWQNAKEQKLLRSKILLKWEKVKSDTFSKVNFFPKDESIFEFKFQNPSKVENVPGLPKWFSPRPPEGGLTRAQKKTLFEKVSIRKSHRYLSSIYFIYTTRPSVALYCGLCQLGPFLSCSSFSLFSFWNFLDP